MTRDNFSASTRRILAERTSFLCSRPECQKLTIGPSLEESKSSCIGRAAHIRAASQGGPRFDQAQTAYERSSIKNGIWLCANCADLIDKDPARFTVEILEKWKVIAEQRSLDAILLGATNKEGCLGSVDALLDEAFDALGGSQYATRITWRSARSDVYEKVGRIIREVKVISPLSFRLKLIEACYLVGKGFPEIALDLLEALNPLGADKTSVDLLRSRCLYDLERIPESIVVLESICSEDNSPAAAFHNLGLAYIMQDNVLLAEEKFRLAIRSDPSYSEAHMMLGVLATRAGDFPRSFHHFDTAYRLNPSDEGIALRFARCLLDSEMLDQAIDVLDKIIIDIPTSSDAWAFLGEAHGRAGLYVEADQALLRALSIDPCNAVAVNNQLVSFVKQGRLDDAVNLIKRTRRLDFSKVDMLDDFERILMSIKT